MISGPPIPMLPTHPAESASGDLPPMPGHSAAILDHSWGFTEKIRYSSCRPTVFYHKSILSDYELPIFLIY